MHYHCQVVLTVSQTKLIVIYTLECNTSYVSFVAHMPVLLSLCHYVYTVEPLSKGHFGTNSCVL